MGLFDNINTGLQNGMQSPLFNLGAGLIAGAQPFQNPGAQLQGAAQATQMEQARQQQLYMQNLQLQMLRQQWPYMQNLFGQLGSLMGSPAHASHAASKSSPKAPPATQGIASAPVVGGFSPLPTSNSVPPAAAPVPSTPGPVAGGPDPEGLERFGLMASMFPMTQPMGKAAQAAAQFEAQNNPALITQRAIAANGLTQDVQMYRNAVAQYGQNSLQAKGALNKYLTDSKILNVAAYNGAVTTTQDITPGQIGVSTMNPVQGVRTEGGVESPIPGAAPTQQALGAARSLGEAAGKTADVGGIPVPLLSLLGHSAPGAPPSAAPNAPAAGTRPNQLLDLLRSATYEKDLGAQGARETPELQKAADTARDMNYSLDQMLKDAPQVSLGPSAAAIEWGQKQVAGLGQIFGIAPPKTLSSYMELDKYGNKIAFAAARQMGARESTQIVQLQMQTNPNKTLTSTAFTDLAQSMKAQNNYIMAKNVAVQQMAGENGGNLALADAQWTKNVDPRVWDLTLSSSMGEKWAATIGSQKIEAAWPYLTPAEQQALVQNIPMSVRKQWLASSKP